MSYWNDGVKMLRGIHCKAEYNEQKIKKYRGNPFIEAIPNRVSIDEFFDKMFSTPDFDSSYLEFEVEDRLELIRQIRPNFWLPLPFHYDKYRGIYNMIKIGYLSRNPIHAIYNKQFSIGWDKIYEAGLDENGANIAGNIQTSQSFAEIGLSGMGKSKIYERILNILFPQVIHHGEYRKRKLTLTQVVWLKIECPSNKSVGALCRNFYDEVDKILGSNFYEKFGEKGGSIEILSKRMVKVAAQINLGVLIIDEIQNVHKAHSGGDQRLINFITELVNTIGVPVIIIGTFKAMYLFKNSLANTRRGIPDDFGENITSFMLEDSWEWNEFIEALWDLQYTKKFTPLTPDLKRAMYFHSLGIPDIAVKLFMHVQSKVILERGDESITLSAINNVASRSLKLLKPIFEKIRKVGLDEELIGEIEDVELEWTSFNAYIKEANHRIAFHGKIKEQHSRIIQKKNNEGILENLIEFANKLVTDRNRAESVAESVYESSKDNDDLQTMYSKIAESLLGLGNSSKSIEQENNMTKLYKKRKKPKLEQQDIRLIVEQGEKMGKTVEESLFDANLVRDFNEILEISKGVI